MGRDDTNIDWRVLGQQFRHQREATATSVETAARQLCLAKSQILALEKGLAENFPGTPARLWCARRYATLLGLDLDAIAPQAGLGASPTEAEINAPAVLDNSLSDSESLARTPPSIMDKVRWFIMLLLLALLVVLAIQSYPSFAPLPVQPKQAVIPEMAPAAIPATPVPMPAPAPVVVPAVPIEEPKPEPERKLVEVQGIDARKPARSIYVMANEAAVLIKQRAGQEAETLNLAEGASQRIPLAADERLRVAEGKKIDMFFQGRKVSTNNIESGDWIRFVPLRGAAVQ